MNARKKNLDQKSAPACPVDISLLAAAGLLLVFGFIMVASASLDLSERTYGDPFYLLIRHGFYLVLALGAASLVLSLPIQIWQKFDIAFLGLALFLLCVVLVPGLGREVNGSTRWIPFGPFSLQGSEFVKLLVAVYISGYLVRRREEIETSLVGFIRPLLVLMLIVTLLLGQPDFGVAIVIVAAAMGVIFLAGVPWRFFLPLVAMTGIMVVLIATLQPYRLARLAAFADPWEHQFDSGYQLTQALIAFGRGEWLGLGLGNSIQKLSFLPEAHNDFIFSIIAEELGFVGAAIVILLFAWLVLRCLIIGLQAKQRGMYFHTYLAWGIGLLLGIQALVNLGVNLGVLPTKGLTLPLMSYGGNSLIVSCMMIAVVLRIEAEFRAAPPVAGDPAAALALAGIGKKPAGIGKKKVGKKKAGIGNKKAGIGKQKAGIGKKPAGIGNKKAGIGNKPAGIGKNKAVKKAMKKTAKRKAGGQKHG